MSSEGRGDGSLTNDVPIGLRLGLVEGSLLGLTVGTIVEDALGIKLSEDLTVGEIDLDELLLG